MLIVALITLIIYSRKANKGMDETIKEEKEILKNQSYEDFFGKA